LPELTLAAAPALTALDATGAEAITQLNSWLQERGFRALQSTETAWFAENACAFLCVMIAPPDGKARLGGAVELPPVKVRFRSDAPFVPLLIGPGQPRGRLDIATITDKPLDTRPYMAARDRIRAPASGFVLLLNLWSVQPLPDALAKALDAKTAEQPPRWYANRMESPGLPEEEGQPRTDLSLPLGDLSDELPGFWYYGDDDISVVERFFREHILAVTTTLFFVGFLALMIKARRNRKRVLHVYGGFNVGLKRWRFPAVWFTSEPGGRRREQLPPPTQGPQFAVAPASRLMAPGPLRCGRVLRISLQMIRGDVLVVQTPPTMPVPHGGCLCPDRLMNHAGDQEQQERADSAER
jgi:hypothetical protein